MATWKEFEIERPDLAQFGKEHFSTNVAYLGTIRPDGSPRVHPVSPIISSERIFVFMEPTSPKGKDLIKNNNYALHSLVTDSNGSNGEFWIHGQAIKVEDKKLRQEATSAAYYTPQDRYILFQLNISEVGSTVYQKNGKPIRNHWSVNKRE